MFSKKGFTLIPVIVITVILVGGFFIFAAPKYQGPASPNSSSTSCPNPLVIQTPVDLEKATSILYPGQVRGGDFKRHGGFRFDDSKNDEIEVRAPIDSSLVAASRYIEQGEVQYLFDFETSCGIKYRFDHLLKLSQKFKEAVDKLPQAKENDSRTTNINPQITVQTDEIIATAVGVQKDQNVFVDFGVYKETIFGPPNANAVCWFDLLPADDTQKIKGLPASDSQSGKTSEYCK